MIVTLCLVRPGKRQNTYYMSLLRILINRDESSSCTADAGVVSRTARKKIVTKSLWLIVKEMSLNCTELQQQNCKWTLIRDAFTYHVTLPFTYLWWEDNFLQLHSITKKDAYMKIKSRRLHKLSNTAAHILRKSKTQTQQQPPASGDVHYTSSVPEQTTRTLYGRSRTIMWCSGLASVPSP